MIHPLTFAAPPAHPLCLPLCTFLRAMPSLCRSWMLRLPRLLAAPERSWPAASVARSAATELLPSTRLTPRACAPEWPNCAPQIPRSLLKLSAAPAHGSQSTAQIFPAIETLARSAILPEDQARFEDFANDAACPALDPATGRCDVYAWRPMTCRVFGPPVRASRRRWRRRPGPLRALLYRRGARAGGRLRNAHPARSRGGIAQRAWRN